jgi:phosphoenolpyruvate carboxylase
MTAASDLLDTPRLLHLNSNIFIELTSKIITSYIYTHTHSVSDYLCIHIMLQSTSRAFGSQFQGFSS